AYRYASYTSNRFQRSSSEEYNHAFLLSSCSSLVGYHRHEWLGFDGMEDRDLMEPNNTQPARRVSMLWVQGTGKGRVKVTGRMRWPTVLLEDIGAVRGVTCEEGMVRVRFGDGDDGGGGDGDGDGDDDDDAFVRARDSWMAHPRFVLVTNALGACDAPAERGIYLANGSAVTVHLSDRRLDVPAQRIDFADAVRTSQVTVKSVRVSPPRRRGGGQDVVGNG
ncbi:hypothetical protein L249_5267, partial [Ophiocordyceps polyrhachis-furcata BCC 54312]